jgi:hypothetical protein
MEERRMQRIQHWGIVGAMVLCQLGVVIAYHILIGSSATPAAAAQTVVATAAENARAQNKVPSAQAEPKVATPAPFPVPVVVAGTNSASGPDSVPFGQDGLVTPAIALPAPPNENIAVQNPLPPLSSPDTVSSGVMPASAQVPPKVDFTPTPPAPWQQPGASGYPMPPPGFGPPSQAEIPKVQLGTKTNGPAKVIECPWDLNIKIVEGRSHLTAGDGKAVKMIIICDQLDMKAPSGAIRATGQVVVQSDGFGGSCDALTISWEERAVQMVNAKVSCNTDGRAISFQGPALQVQLTPIVAAPKVQEIPPGAQ